MIHWNWQPTDPIFMDLETASAANLRAVGSRKYIQHPSTRIISAAFLHRGVVSVWIPHECPEEIPTHPDFNITHGPAIPSVIADAIREGATFVAHNAEAFDSQVWERFAPRDLQPTWYDTMHASRAAGLPGGLDSACEMLGLPRKSEGGKDFLMLLSKVPEAAPGKPFKYHVGTVALWENVLKYNIQDVVIMEQLYNAIRNHLTEFDTLDTYVEINRRGVKVDPRFAACVRAAWDAAKEDGAHELDELTDGEMADKPGSAPRFKRWLATMGFVVDSLNRQKIQSLINGDFFGDPETDPVAAKIVAAIAARQICARATVGKIDRIFQTFDDDKRCRDLIVYHGAHTGRATSRRIQVHNMPRGIKLNLDSIIEKYNTTGHFTLEDIRAAALPGANIGDAVATLTRPILVADIDRDFLVADYASVEARGVSWLANDQAALASFASDPYCFMASQVFGRPITKADERERQIGKVIVLGCGYSMGPFTFEESCKLMGVDLSAVGLTGETCVRAYRSTFPRIQSLWWDLQRAATAVIAEGNSIAATNRCTFERVGSSMHLTLPSGRKLVYRDVGWRPGEKGKELTYRSVHGYTTKLYGGKIAENVVQAMCRDIHHQHMVTLNRAYPVVIHVHDEIVFELLKATIANAFDAIGVAMSTPPRWAEGFPLAVELFTCKHYAKSKPKSSLHGEFSLGKRVK